MIKYTGSLLEEYITRSMINTVEAFLNYAEKLYYYMEIKDDIIYA